MCWFFKTHWSGDVFKPSTPSGTSRSSKLSIVVEAELLMPRSINGAAWMPSGSGNIEGLEASSLIGSTINEGRATGGAVKWVNWSILVNWNTLQPTRIGGKFQKWMANNIIRFPEIASGSVLEYLMCHVHKLVSAFLNSCEFFLSLLQLKRDWLFSWNWMWDLGHPYFENPISLIVIYVPNQKLSPFDIKLLLTSALETKSIFIFMFSLFMR